MRESPTRISVVQSSISRLPDSNSLGIEATAVWLARHAVQTMGDVSISHHFLILWLPRNEQRIRLQLYWNLCSEFKMLCKGFEPKEQGGENHSHHHDGYLSLREKIPYRSHSIVTFSSKDTTGTSQSSRRSSASLLKPSPAESWGFHAKVPVLSVTTPHASKSRFWRCGESSLHTKWFMKRKLKP
jgi:hypothetical protein